MKQLAFKIIGTISILLSLTAAAFGQNQPEKVKDGYKIDIQTSAICEMCQYTLEKELTFEKGVKEASLNLENKVVTILYNPEKTTAEALRERITKVGYHADTLARDPDAYAKLPMCCKDGSHGTPIPQLPVKSDNQN